MLSSLHRFSVRRSLRLTCHLKQCTTFCTSASSEHEEEQDEQVPDDEYKIQVTAQIHPEFLQEFDQRNMSYFNHPGIRRQPCFKLPALLELAAKRGVSKYLNENFRERVGRHWRGFDLMELPDEVEDEKLREQMINDRLAHEIPLSEQMKEQNPDEYEYLKTKKDKKFHSLMNKFRPSWRHVDYDEEKAAIYLASRFVPNYASLRWVFMDLAKSDPDFVPKTLFDFGSGLGTTMHAANSVWPQKINEHMNIDINKPMNQLCDFLLRDGHENRPQLYPGVYYREYLPVSSQIKYDLVVSAFTMLELPSRAARIQAIEALWRKTQDTLIVVERGTRYGFATVLEARNFVLQDAGYDVNKSYYVKDENATQVQPLDPYNLPDAYIQGPCPHHFACPRLFTGGPIMCNFGITYFPLDIGSKDYTSMDTKFSYVILRKGKKTLEGPFTWPRIVQPIKRPAKQAICRFCCPDGSVKSATFSRLKHKGHMYKLAKHSTWGDLLPVTVFEEKRTLNNWNRLKIRIREERDRAERGFSGNENE